MQHSSRAFPVVNVDGLSFNVRRKGGGTFGDLAAAFVREVSLPQNVATKQGGNHAIAEDCDRRRASVAAGQPAGVGDGVRGSEAQS